MQTALAANMKNHRLVNGARSRRIFPNYMSCYPDCMSQDTKPAIDDDLRDAIEEDERAALIAELRHRAFVEDASPQH
jgi:hypothetical protein